MQKTSEMAVHKQMFALKKKIQLSEGQRKAAFEDCDAEKRRNIDQIDALRKDIATLTCEWNAITTTTTNTTTTSSTSTNQQSVLARAGGRKTCEEIVVQLDLQKTDRIKAINLIRYRIKQKQNQLLECGRVYQELKAEKSRKFVVEKVVKPTNKVVRNLENSLHAIEVQIREANHVCERYSSIRKYLEEDAAKFESKINGIDRRLREQMADNQRLKEIVDEATRVRSIIQNRLVTAERVATGSAQSREHATNQTRRLVANRRRDLEHLEQRIWQQATTTGTAPPPTSTHTNLVTAPATTTVNITASAPRSSRGGGDIIDIEQTAGGAESNVDNEAGSNEHEEVTATGTFDVLKEVTGATDLAEVLDKFSAQRGTHARLVALRKHADEEKRTLERRYERILNVLQGSSHEQTRDVERKSLRNEDLKSRIDYERKRSESYKIAKVKHEKVLGAIALGARDLLYTLSPNVAPPIGRDADCVAVLAKIKEAIHRHLQTKENLQHRAIGGDIISTTNRHLVAGAGGTNVDDVIEDASEQDTTEEKLASNIDVSDMKWLPSPYHGLLRKTPVPQGVGAGGGGGGGGGSSPAPPNPPHHGSEEEEEVPSRGFLKRQAQLVVDAKSRRKNIRMQTMRRN